MGFWHLSGWQTWSVFVWYFCEPCTCSSSQKHSLQAKLIQCWRSMSQHSICKLTYNNCFQGWIYHSIDVFSIVLQEFSSQILLFLNGKFATVYNCIKTVADNPLNSIFQMSDFQHFLIFPSCGGGIEASINQNSLFTSEQLKLFRKG